MNIYRAEEIVEQLHEAVYDFGCNEFIGKLCWYQSEVEKYYAHQQDGHHYFIKNFGDIEE